MQNVLLIDFGSTYTKITAVDIEREVILGAARAITTVDTDITAGLDRAMAEMFAATGQLEFAKVLGCSSAAGGLKMVAIGLVPELTAEAAKRAALGAGARVLRVFGHELSEYELAEIDDLKPDIILLAGGTDGGNKQVILHNAGLLARLGLDIPVVVAGNKSVAPAVVKILNTSMSQVVPTANVMPRLNELNIEPARQAIREIFLRRIVEAKGLHKANGLVDRLVMPTPAAVLRAAELLSTGWKDEAGIGDLMVVDIGGATTDVYSVAEGRPTTNAVLRGLPEPFAKRTVEGDLGMRYSAAALLQAAGPDLLADFAQASAAEVCAYVGKVAENTAYLPQTAAEQLLESAMGRACTKLGSERHAGTLETSYSALGPVFVQTGKDLTEVKTVIGTGGIIINSMHSAKILDGILYETGGAQYLKPKRPVFMIDKDYVLAALGLLSEDYPATAVRMMKKYIVRGNQ